MYTYVNKKINDTRIYSLYACSYAYIQLHELNLYSAGRAGTPHMAKKRPIDRSKETYTYVQKRPTFNYMN